MKSRCFPPISTKKSAVLILGSMPGVQSLEKGEYYAHPRNLFWQVMGILFEMPVATYRERVRLIRSNHLALWDVMECCFRIGSLDTKIEDSSIVVNDFTSFLSKHRCITHIFFNGTKAEKEFMKRVKPYLPEKFADIEYYRLPSTSPAMAGMKLADKVKVWGKVKKALD